MCKCGLNENVCNSKQKWNHDECWCERKELDDCISCKGVTHGIHVHVIVSVMKHVKLMSF